MSDAPLSRRVRPKLRSDLRLTLWPLRHGHGDPTIRVEGSGAWWRATRTPEGPATGRYSESPGGVDVTAWGPGAAWILEAAPDLLGAGDSLAGFDPAKGLIRELHRRLPGLRITRSRAVFETILPTIIEQKVIGAQARASYRDLVRAVGEPAPGPVELMLPPAAEALSRRPPHAFHPLGIEGRRAATIRAAAADAAGLERLVELPLREAYLHLLALPGIGPWTAAEVGMVALGDADAVSVGDYHLPNLVAWALAGEPRGTDERMLELLEPYQGHRGRVLRLLLASGIHAPRYGPKLAMRSIRSM